MSDTKHTPGPWSYHSGPLRRQFPEIIHEIIAPDRKIVKWLGFDGLGKKGGESVSIDEIAANCRLIAAAPDLLAALEAAPEPPSLGADARERECFVVACQEWEGIRAAALAKAKVKP